MTLHNILRAVLAQIGTTDHAGGTNDFLTIARAGEHAYQVRFFVSSDCKRGYRIEGRRWMDGTELTPTRGTERAYVGWARWSTHLGWSIEAVLADDWRFVS